MKTASKSYIDRLRIMYKNYGDSDSLLALAEVESLDERIRELTIYREQEKTQELIAGAIRGFKTCVEKLTNQESMKMTDIDRAYLFAKMDWCRFTLDIVGQSPEGLEKQVDDMVESYARKAGIT